MWLCQCPIFRKFAFSKVLKGCKKRNNSENDGLTEIEKKQFAGLLQDYDSSNQFLYSSLNMEIVCTILKGINVVLREINLDNKQQIGLKDIDFKEIKVARLKTI